LTRAVPDRATVLAELDELRLQASSTGERVSVLALAKRVGLANTTFRRRFPDITESITAEDFHAPAPATDTTAVTADSEAKLRQRNRDLQENLELAIAAIQRLTLENRSLREHLAEAARTVTPIRPRPSADASALSDVSK
jgi:hypothetical protein